MEGKRIYTICQDAKIYLEIRGKKDNPALVLLHGNSEDLTILKPQYEAFSKDYYCISIDSRGHGKSEWGKGPLTIERIAEDIVQVLDALEISAAHLLGFSDGGNITLQMAAHHRDRLLSITVVGANLFPTGMKAKVLGLVLLQYTKERLVGLWNTESRKKAKITALMLFHPHIRPRELKRFSGPALVVAGQYDMVQESHTRLIARSLKESQLVIVEKAGHFIPMKRPEMFNQLVMDFLRKQSH